MSIFGFQRSISPERLPSRWTTLRKLADQTVNDSTVLVDDAVLQFPVIAGGKYTFKMVATFTTAAAADFKFRHTGPASPTLYQVTRRHIIPSGNALAGVMAENAYSGADVTVVSTVGSTAGWVWIEGVIHNGTTAGAWKFQWAQNTQDASDTKVITGSYLEWMRVE